MKKIAGNINLKFSDFLNGSRPVKYVRRMQGYLLVTTLLMFTALLSYPSFRVKELDLTKDGPWTPGRTAPFTVVAFTTIEFPNLELYENNKKEAVARTPLRFIRNYRSLSLSPASSEATDAPPDSTKRLLDTLNHDIEKIHSCARTRKTLPGKQFCVRRLDEFVRLTENEATYVLYQSPSDLVDSIGRAANLIFQKFLILDGPLDDPVFTGSLISVKEIGSGASTAITSLPVDHLIEKRQLFHRDVQSQFEDLLQEKMSDKPKIYRIALAKIAAAYLKQLSAVRFSPEETERLRLDAVKKVSVPIYQISRGDVIVEKDEVIRDEKFEALKIYNRARFLDKVRRILAIFIQQVILLGLMLYFAWRFSVARLNDVSSNLIVFLNVWIFALVLIIQENYWSSNVNYNEVTHFFGAWVPIGFFVMLLSVMFGEVLTLPIAIYMTFMIFIASKYDGNSLLIALVSAIAGSIIGSHIRRRLHFIYAALLLAFVSVLMVTASYLYSNRPIISPILDASLFSDNYLEAIRVTFFSSVISVLIIAILPIFESIFNVVTRFKLIELADPAHPLLKELFQKAPSTWTHTQMVAAMSEKACERLGLDTMLTRTGVYYHDIGKMKNAGFFIENQHLIPRPENVDRHNPQKTAKVIIDHVLDGIVLARTYRLPREVMAFIPEHHGTSTMTFFYHKALEKMKRKVNRDDFRYPGPRPQRKETGIVMIADSVEAASRSLDDVSEKSIRNLIHRIVTIKLEENQLDESGLTVGDLTVIQEAFKDVLMSSYHFRPRYPTASDMQKLENDRNAQNAKGAKKNGKESVAAKKTGTAERGK